MQQRTIINTMENRKKNRENSINQEVGSSERSIKLASSRLTERKRRQITDTKMK